MARVNITIPDDVVAAARSAGLNVSRLATAAIVDELDRRDKIDALDALLAQMEVENGPIPDDEQLAAAVWAEQIFGPVGRPSARTGRQRA